MSRNRLDVCEASDCIDCLHEKNTYWCEVLNAATRILASNDPGELLADFVTKIAYREVDLDTVDPLDVLTDCADEWGVELDGDDDEYDYVGEQIQQHYDDCGLERCG